MKDIFIDTNLAINLVTPLNDNFKTFLSWLYLEGALVVNSKLKGEFFSGNQTLSVVLNKLSRDGRVNTIKSVEINALKFTKAQEKKMLSNYKDRIHLKSVFLSHRKIALSNDKNFINDINTFNKINGIQPFGCDCPSKVDYK